MSLFRKKRKFTVPGVPGTGALHSGRKVEQMQPMGTFGIFRCPKMGLRAPESKNGDHFFTRTPPQNGGLGICFMCLPRKVIFGHFIDFEYFGSDFSCFYIVKTPEIEMASRLSFMGL